MTLPVWIAFLAFVVVMVALDLGVFHRRIKAPSIGNALGWTLVWVVLALLFNLLVYVLYENNYSWASLPTELLSGRQAATQFLLGYVLEKSLSVDNIFVIAMVFAYFRVPLAMQHRVLFWGILGAVVLRGLMIALGVVLINRFEWITYVFGAFLIYSAVKMMVLRHETLDATDSVLVKLAKRWIPFTDQFHGHHFFAHVDGRKLATPLFLALLLAEGSDVMFAVDSIPAIFAVTREPFIIFTSNVFAILGLRSLYFVLAAYMERFRYLKSALVYVLAYIGVKMILANHFHIPEMVSLGVVAGILSVGILASIVGAGKDPVPLRSPLESETDTKHVPESAPPRHGS